MQVPAEGAGPGELELQTVGRHLVWVMGTELRSSGRAANTLSVGPFLQSP